jgi:hypothetical protein
MEEEVGDISLMPLEDYSRPQTLSRHFADYCKNFWFFKPVLYIMDD